MNDPFGNMNGLINQFRQFMGNPMQFLSQKNMNIPQEYLNDPNKAIQEMMNSGMISQQQFEWAKRTAGQIQNNPMFMQIFGKK